MAELELQAILPKGVQWWNQDVTDLLQKSLFGVARNAEGFLKGVTSSWSPPVDFTVIAMNDSAWIMTSDNRFLWVDEGTRPHPIRARRARRLRLITGYSPITSPGVIRRTGTGRGTGIAFRRRVYHPGIRPRRLSERVQKLTQPLLEYRINQVLAKLSEG